MDKNSRPKIYGVLGYPARHSLSPAMHNAAFRALKINAEYKIFEKKPEELQAFLLSLPEENIHGLNVTIPYKEKVIPILNKVSAEAKLIGAVNTVRVSDKGLEGFNTDGEGFLRHLTEDLRFNPEDKIIAIIGAGGAARAVSVFLSKAGPKAIAIHDTDEAKAEVLAGHLRTNFKEIEIKLAHSIEELNIPGSQLLINATPVGMKEDDPLLVDKKFIHRYLLVYDLIYNPPETKLLNLAKKAGAKIANGLGMLLYQGMRSFEIWTGQSAPKEVMRQALLEAI
jgi:shikimate dehydrogenase